MIDVKLFVYFFWHLTILRDNKIFSGKLTKVWIKDCREKFQYIMFHQTKIKKSFKTFCVKMNLFKKKNLFNRKRISFSRCERFENIVQLNSAGGKWYISFSLRTTINLTEPRNKVSFLFFFFHIGNFAYIQNNILNNYNYNLFRSRSENWTGN